MSHGYISLFEFVFNPPNDWCVGGWKHGKFRIMCLHNVDISKIEDKLYTQCLSQDLKIDWPMSGAITEEHAQHYSAKALKSRNWKIKVWAVSILVFNYTPSPKAFTGPLLVLGDRGGHCHSAFSKLTLDVLTILVFSAGHWCHWHSWQYLWCLMNSKWTVSSPHSLLLPLSSSLLLEITISE